VTDLNLGLPSAVFVAAIDEAAAEFDFRHATREGGRIHLLGGARICLRGDWKHQRAHGCSHEDRFHQFPHKARAERW